MFSGISQLFTALSLNVNTLRPVPTTSAGFIMIIHPTKAMTDLMNYQNLQKDRKQWHRLAAIMDEDTPTCGRCGGPLETVADPEIGVELVCKNPDCETYN
jgi:putative hemolysin